MSDDEDNESATTDMSVSNYKAEIKFLKTKTELEIENIKKILSSLPPKNIRASRKNLTEQEKKKKATESNRIYLSRKSNLIRLQTLMEEHDTYEDIIKDDDLKRIQEIIDAKKDLINTINTELEDEKEELKEDFLLISDDNTQLQAKIKQLIAENEELKKKVYIQPQAPTQYIQSPAQNYMSQYNYEIPSTLFKPQQQRYINTC